MDNEGDDEDEAYMDVPRGAAALPKEDTEEKAVIESHVRSRLSLIRMLCVFDWYIACHCHVPLNLMLI